MHKSVHCNLKGPAINLENVINELGEIETLVLISFEIELRVDL
jgi:hypothetical protein